MRSAALTAIHSLVLVILCLTIDAFTNIPSTVRCAASHSCVRSNDGLSLSLTSQSATNNEEILQSIRSLRVKQIKSELEALNISTADAFEKEELVQRLLRARLSGAANKAVAAKTSKKKKRRTYDDDIFESDTTGSVIDNQDSQGAYYSQNAFSSPITDATIKAPFIYFSLDSRKQIQDRQSQDVYIRPSPGKYAAVEVKLQSKNSQHSVEYTLLVDTACSGIVLSPQAITRAGGLIQTIKGAASMTTAGGGQGGYDIAKWGDKSTTKFIVGGVDVNEIEGFGGSMMNMAAVNDIGALPDGLDGILGLSFLNKVSSLFWVRAALFSLVLY